MAAYDLSFLQPDEWERYKRSLPESIESGPQSEYELRMMQREAENQEPSTFQKGLRVFQDVQSAAQGRPGPTMLERSPEEEPGRWEKAISPVADVVSVLSRGRVASREARMAREQMALNRRKQDMELVNSWFKMQNEISDHIHHLPPSEQADYAEEAATMLDGVFPNGGDLVRHEFQNPGSLPEDFAMLVESFPELNAVYAASGVPGLQEWVTKPENLVRVTQSLDARALPAVSEWWNQSEAWLDEYAPEVLDKVRKDGLTEVGEIPEIIAALPEQLRPSPEDVPKLIDWLRRNASIISFVDEEKYVASVKEKRATTRGRVLKPSEQWGPVYYDEAGQAHRKNLVTGESILAGPPPKPTAKSRGMVEAWEPDADAPKLVFEMTDGSFHDQMGNTYVGPPGTRFAKIGTGSRASAKDLSETLGESALALSDVIRVRALLKPGVVGFRGAAGRLVAGVAGAVGGKQAGEDVARLSGYGLGEGSSATQEEMIEFHQLATKVSASMVTYFTREGGKRISDRELQIAIDACKLLASATNVTQAEAATRNIMRAYLKSEFAKAMDSGKPLFDLDDPEDVSKLDLVLKDQLGISPNEAIEWGRDYRKQYQIWRGLSSR